jgi:hypothetical protein
LTGPRGTGLTTTLCPGCRNSRFVLPASVYPRPKSAQRKPTASLPQRRGSERAVRPEPRESAVQSPETSSPLRPGGHVQPSIAARAPAVEKPAVADARLKFDFERLRGKMFSPLRLVLGGVGVVVALTVWWLVQQHERDVAEKTIVAAVREADAALREHDLGEAARQYTALRQALDRLGRRDPQARRLRQAANEVTAAADLSRVSLFDLLHEAATMAAGAARGSWAATFQSSYRDEWIVVDALVTRMPDSANKHQYEIEFPLVDGIQRARLVANLTAFDELQIPDGKPQRVIFAGQLEACRQDPQLEDSWDIVLRAETGFLWSSAAHLELLGLQADDETQRLLVSQSTRLGMAP